VVFGGDLGGSDKFPYVDVDNVQGGYLATKHLISQGCKKIIMITGDLKLQSGRDRLEGFEKAMSEAGREISPSSVLTGDYSMSTAEEVIREFLKKKISFDGIFAGNDLSAVGAINVLLQNKISVPKQVKVVGFDNSPVATRSVPALTSIHQPIRELGAEVANMLVAALSGSEVTKKMLPVKLVARESSAKN
jgi:DNA-binding LacI/PurR family transcriptional regulator